MAFLGPYNAALINPSLVLLSEAFGVNSKTAAYSTTTGIIMGGVSPFIWTPLTNVYGRRPITLLAILITILGGIGSGASTNFAALLGTRAMCGFGFGGMMSVGTSSVNDIFFLHERGEKTGIYSLFVTNGAHVAALGEYLLIPTYLAACMHKLGNTHTLSPSSNAILTPHSRRFPRPICRLAMGLLPRRSQHHRLPTPRNFPLPRNTVLARPSDPLPTHPRTQIHSNAVLLPSQPPSKPQAQSFAFPALLPHARLP